MKVKCPSCRYEYNIKDATREEDLLAILKMRDDFVPHAKLVFEYAELFVTTRPIKAAKLLRILTEIKSIWKAERFKMRKRTYSISSPGIMTALTMVCNRTFTDPLTNHNYLKKVMTSIAEKEEETRSIEGEKALKKKEKKLTSGAVQVESVIERVKMPENVKDFIKEL
jgi:hypothetical protein